MSKGRYRTNASKSLAQRHQKHTALSDQARQTLLPQANQLAIVGCWISPGWEQSTMGLVQVLIVRRQPDTRLAYATFLIDVYCLGVKDAHYDLGLTDERFHAVLRHLQSSQPLMECTVEVAHQMIYQALDYAARWGFIPHPDFAKASNFLAPRGTYDEPYSIVFGKDGQPFFVQGPYDDVRTILAQLEKTAGPGKYNYLVKLEE